MSPCSIRCVSDSRRATLVAGIGVGLIVLATASQVASEFGTAQARATMATLPEQLPATTVCGALVNASCAAAPAMIRAFCVAVIRPDE